jgi:hypothetical protein
MATATDERIVQTTAGPSRFGLTLPEVCAVVAVLLPVVLLQRELSTVDLTYHLRAGALMLHTHSIIRTDTFSFTAHGDPWLDQQWGAQVLMYAAYRTLGWSGLTILYDTLIGATFAFVYLAARAAGAPARWAAGLSMGGFAVSYVNLALRPQMFGVLAFALCLWIVWGRRAHAGRLWAIPVIVTVWSNLHGTFFLGPLLLCLALFQDAVERRPGGRRLALITAASLAATLLNPWGVKVWSYAINIGANSLIARSISEWQPPTIRHISGLLLFGSLSAVVIVLARRGRPVPWSYLAWLGVFFLVGVWASRNTVWWGLILPPTVAAILTDGGAAPSHPYPRLRINVVLAVTFIALVPATFPWWFASGHLHSRWGGAAYAPTELTAELRDVVTPGERIFNAQAWGSWLELALPRNPVAVDSRIEIYSHAVWSDYETVSAGQTGWKEILNRWHVGAAAIRPEEQGSLIERMSRDSDWRLVDHIGGGFIFVRVGPAS